VDNSALVVGVLMATVLLRVVLVLGAVWWLIPRRARCPHCADETAAVTCPRTLTLLGLQHRWCMACGWTGLSKRLTHASRAEVSARSSAGSAR
jgi:hypothetical protein